MPPLPTLTRGQRVARNRERLNLSQSALAQLCRCDVRTIARIESDEGRSVTLRLIEALSKQLGLPRSAFGEASRRGRWA